MLSKKSGHSHDEDEESGSISDAVGKLLDSRVIVFDKDVDEETASNLIAKIVLLNHVDPGSTKPIVILINSRGGDTYSGFGVVDVIRASACPVYTVCIGQALSCGALILAAGHKRYALPSTRIMIHQHWAEFSESLTHAQILNEAEETERTMRQALAILRKCTGMSNAVLEKLLSTDTYMTAAEAKNFNLVDEIGWKIHAWMDSAV